MKLIKSRGNNHEFVKICRAVDYDQLVKNLNRNMRSALADNGCYTCKEIRALFNFEGDANLHYENKRIVTWAIHKKAVALGVSIHWLLMHKPRDGMIRLLPKELEASARSITKEQMRENIASHVIHSRREIMLNQNEYYYFVTGEEKALTEKGRDLKYSKLVSKWEAHKAMPIIQVIAGIARAEGTTEDHILYTKVHERGESDV